MSALPALSVMRHCASRLDMAGDDFKGKERDDWREAARDLRTARDAVSKLIEAAELTCSTCSTWPETAKVGGLRDALAAVRGGAM